MKPIERLLDWWTARVLRRPRLVLGAVLISCVLSVYVTMTRLEVATDQLELISPKHPLIALSDRLDIFKSHQSSYTVIIESSSPERSIAFANRLSGRLQSDPAYFKEVIARVDPAAIRQWMLLYLDKQDIEELRERLKKHAPLIKSLAASQDVVQFLKLINQEMASRMVGELFTGFLDETAPPKAPAGSRETLDLTFLKVTLQDLASHLNGSTAYTSPWKGLLQNESWDLDQQGYFWEGKKRYLMLFVYPQKAGYSSNREEDPLVRLRSAIRDVRSEFQDVSAGVTGQEALGQDEMRTVRQDMLWASGLALGGVLVLMAVLMRGLRRPLLEMVCLIVGLCWTFGWTTVVIGHLNILSIVFAPLLCGLGVDYGIHWFARYDEEERLLHSDPFRIVKAVTQRSGPPIFIAGLSAALSLLPFVLTGFRGLVELGLITGIGILLILVSTLTVLPALTLVIPPRRSRIQPYKGATHSKAILQLNRKRKRTLAIGTVLLSLVSIWGALRVHFDLNPLRLQPASSEAVAWERALIASSERSVLSAVTMATSVEELSRKTRAFLKLPSVSEVESIFTLLPQSQEEKITLLRTLSPMVPEVRPMVLQNKPADLADFIRTLERLSFKMNPDAALKGGADKRLVEDMAQVRRLIDEIVLAAQKRPDALERFFEYRRQFREDLLQTWGFLRKGVTTSPMGIEHLPQSIRDWYYSDGRLLIRIYPKESIWEEGALSRFVNDIQTVDKEVAGDPVSLHAFAFAFRDACIHAAVYAVAAVFILLLLTLRRISHALLALCPLALGALWTFGIMGLANVPFNLANSIFMPLVVGAGVEYGVIIIHRWREGSIEAGHLPVSTGKGVVLAALTTTIGFGVLMISQHRGIFSLGFVAFTGSLCVLAAAMLVLPMVLSFLASPKPVHRWRR